MTNFQGEEKLAYHREEGVLSMPVAASFRRRNRTRWSQLVANTQAGRRFFVISSLKTV